MQQRQDPELAAVSGQTCLPQRIVSPAGLSSLVPVQVFCLETHSVVDSAAAYYCCVVAHRLDFGQKSLKRFDRASFDSEAASFCAIRSCDV